MTRAADDFAAIRARLNELRAARAPTNFGVPQVVVVVEYTISFDHTIKELIGPVAPLVAKPLPTAFVLPPKHSD